MFLCVCRRMGKSFNKDEVECEVRDMARRKPDKEHLQSVLRSIRAQGIDHIHQCKGDTLCLVLTGGCQSIVCAVVAESSGNLDSARRSAAAAMIVFMDYSLDEHETYSRLAQEAINTAVNVKECELVHQLLTSFLLYFHHGYPVGGMHPPPNHR